MRQKKVAAKRQRNFDDVVFLNPATCGIYKDGGARYKINPRTGERTQEIDDELGEQVEQYLNRKPAAGMVKVDISEVFDNQVLVPRYYDARWNEDIATLLDRNSLESVTLGDLERQKVIKIRNGHGSPSNDQRNGTIPYIKVSDIRSLRMNVNPTNLVTQAVAKRHWKGEVSGLESWDLITPNRASSNIGEFALILPGEQEVVVTKEVFVIRILGGQAEGWDHFYLFWALCLQAVRRQWQRVALMQTNREDCGDRHLEIIVPKPKSAEWAKAVSAGFRDYFTTLAKAKIQFLQNLGESGFEYIASAHTVGKMSVEGYDNGEASDQGDD